MANGLAMSTIVMGYGQWPAIVSPSMERKERRCQIVLSPRILFFNYHTWSPDEKCHVCCLCIQLFRAISHLTHKSNFSSFARRHRPYTQHLMNINDWMGYKQSHKVEAANIYSINKRKKRSTSQFTHPNPMVTIRSWNGLKNRGTIVQWVDQTGNQMGRSSQAWFWPGTDIF